MTKIKKITWDTVTHTLRTAFSTSLGKKSFLQSIIIQVNLDDNNTVNGEIPTSFTSPEETVTAIQQILDEISPKLKNMPIKSYKDYINLLRKKYSHFPLLVSGLEVALFRAYLNTEKNTEYTYWGGKSTAIETDVTIPFLPDHELLQEWLRYCIERKFMRYKLKISGDLNRDKIIISIVYTYLKTHLDYFTLQFDGNQGYTPETFLALTDFIAKNGYIIQLFEQPLKKDDYKGLQFIKKQSSLPIILDETVWNIKDLKRAISDDLGHGINIKIAKSGISETTEMIKMAQKNNLSLMIGCMTETMTGLSAGIYCAAGTGAFDYIDLDSVHLYHFNNKHDHINIFGPKYIIK